MPINIFLGVFLIKSRTPYYQPKSLTTRLHHFISTCLTCSLLLALFLVFSFLYIFSYLSEEDVLDQVNPFVQLISGVVWLLRNGEIYISESIQAECDKTQETGKI